MAFKVLNNEVITNSSILQNTTIDETNILDNVFNVSDGTTSHQVNRGDTVTFTAGTGITVTQLNGTVTISGEFEDIADQISPLLVHTNHTNIDATYDDLNDQILLAVNITTDSIAEGTTNLYYTDARVSSYLTANSYATESYVDTEITSLSSVYVDVSGDTMTGALVLSGAPTLGSHAATKDYVDSAVSSGTGALTTDDIPEGSLNLYYTDARVDARIPVNVSSFTNDAGYITSYTNTTYDLSVPVSTTSIRLAGSDATNDDVAITGGTNVTVTRTSGTELTISSVDTTYTAGTGVDITAGVISIGQDVSTTATPTFTTIETTGNATIGGNLTVNGTVTTVNTETVTIQDNIILLNSNATGAATEDSGIEIERGDDTNVSLLWDETNDFWSVGTETFVAGTFSGSLSGNADTATLADTADAWTTARTITLGGDLTGNVSVDGSADVTLTATIAANSVALGTDTTGNYAGSVLAGSGINVSGTAGEGIDYTVSHADTSSVIDLTASGRTYVTGLTFDGFGHVTGFTTGSETVVNTDTYLSGLGFNTSDGVLTATLNDASTITVDLDGRYQLTGSYLTAETDTLQSVTSRGNTTSTTVSITNTTGSTSDITGALTVGGGVGIAENLYIGGDTNISGDALVSGNLTVLGTTTTVDVASLAISDNLIYLNNGGVATITNVVGNGSTVTYTADNNFSAGFSVDVTGVNPSAYNVDDAIITSANATSFTISSTATGTYVSGGSARAHTNTNVDLGWAGSYNDGSYAHAGLFRDASDSVFKVFDGYTPEPDDAVDIDTSHASFNLANFQAATFIGDLTGNADTSDKWSTARTITLGGDLTGNVSIDGSANVTLTATVAANSVALGTDTTGNYVAGLTAGTGIGVTGTAGEGWSPTVTHSNTTRTNTTSSGSLTHGGTFDIVDSVTTNALGHVTGVNTKTLTMPNDSNTTYSISSETGTGGASLRLTGSDTSTDNVLFAGGSNVAVTRTDANTITISATDTNTTYSAGTDLSLAGTTFNHANSGVTAGSYNNVTVNARGHVTGGSNVSYLTAETDTLNTVTTRGATTGNAITVGGLTVNGNLTVTGTTTTVNTTTVNIADNIMTLNSDVTGTPSENSGIEVERGTSANVALLWNEATDRWTFTNDGTNYNNILLSSDLTIGNGTQTVTAGSYLTGGGSFSANQTTNTSVTLNVDATSANTASKVVARDASGNFSAGTISANLSGTATNAVNADYLNQRDATQFIWDGGTAAIANMDALGTQSAKYRWNSSTVGRPAAAQTNEYGTLLHLDYDGTNYASQMAYDHFANNLYLRTLTYSTGLGSAWNKVWHDNNDGAGSGLDADTVDGLQASSFLRSDTSDTMSGSLTVTGNLYLNSAQIYGGFGAETTAGTTDWNDSTNARSGNGYTLLLGTHTNGPGTSNYYHPLSFEYSSKDGSGNMTQFAIPYTGDNMFFRSRYSGAWSGWTKLATTTYVDSSDALKVSKSGDTMSSDLIITAIGANNNAAATDNIKVSGYGIIGNRGTFYVTNPGTVQIGVGATHNANPAFSFTATKNTSHKSLDVSGEIVATGDVCAYGTVSDRRMKENVVQLDNALEKVNQLNGYTFNYIGHEDRMTGVMAQEVAEVLPEAVFETKAFGAEEPTMAVRHGNMVGLLIEAIKDLTEQNRQMAQELAEIKKQLNN